MWFSKSKNRLTRVLHSESERGVLDQESFWQIVRAERERADRSGIPVTVAIFTCAGQGDVRDWNRSALVSELRSTARYTDHVGYAGDDELGVILWGTRKVGAYRFVNRLGEKASRMSSECRLFVYPNSDDDDAEENVSGKNTDKNIQQVARKTIRNPASMFARETHQQQPTLSRKTSTSGSTITNATRLRSRNLYFENFEHEFGSSQSDLYGRHADGLTSPAEYTTAQSSAVVALKTDKVDVSQQKHTSADDPELQVDLKVHVEPLENVFVRPTPVWKRATDVLVSGTVLLLSAPLIAFVATWLRLTADGCVWNRRTVQGRGAHPFPEYSFRQVDGNHWFSGILNSSAVRKLPQLWNVFLGDMTLVGPKALTAEEAHRLAQWTRRRLHVKPGFIEATPQNQGATNDWARMDIRYTLRMSPLSDFRILWATVCRRFSGGDASA